MTVNVSFGSSGSVEEAGVQITDRAAEQIRRLIADQPEGTGLRVRIAGGGCSGFQYSFDLDKSTSSDAIFGDDSAQVVVDPASLGLIAGSVIDYVSSLQGSQFVVQNPNAASTCGCGTSFSI